jgi:hypothetical protein
VQHGGQVGRVELLERREQVGGSLSVLVDAEAAEVAPLDRERLAAATQALARPPDEHPGDLPVPRALLLDADVLDCDRRTVLDQGDRAVEHLAEHQRLGLTLLEPAHVDQAGRDDLAGVDGRHPGHRDEDPPAAGHLHDKPEHAGLLGADPQRHDDVADPPHLVADRVEQRTAGEACHEDPCRRASHEKPG